MKNALPVYIGFDTSQRMASEVCAHSLLRRTSIPLMVRHLDLESVKRNGMFGRPSYIRDGQRYDYRDGKPFSTDFSFTRFLVPMLDIYTGWALFCDGDFLFLSDVAELLAHADDKYAAMVVKHRHDPAGEKKKKMDGREQTAYRRKNWSSLVLWNCAHAAHRDLTPAAINHEPGSWLHAFGWLEDHHIGELPATWNHLVGVNKATEGPIHALHYTLGGPWFARCRETEYADLWFAEHRDYWESRYPGIAAPVFEAA